MSNTYETNPVDLICDNIWVGGIDSLFSNLIERNNIKAVISLVDSKLPNNFV